MLSYQHLYHAGNLGDVHKHALLAWCLAYLTRKDKPFTYFETHAGRGLYDLDAPEALKTGEASQGIARAETLFPRNHPYIRALESTRAERTQSAYPGSPLIAGHILREGDTVHLCEMHPTERETLDYAAAPFGAHIYGEDGLAKVLSLCPPTPRRGFVLIDPSYEVKTDYSAVPKTIFHLARKWNVGIIAVWYPILTGDDAPHREMVREMRAAHTNLFVHEVSFPPARKDHRMIGSGMAIINPPYGIEAEAKRLSALFHTLSR